MQLAPVQQHRDLDPFEDLPHVGPAGGRRQRLIQRVFGAPQELVDRFAVKNENAAIREPDFDLAIAQLDIRIVEVDGELKHHLGSDFDLYPFARLGLANNDRLRHTFRGLHARILARPRRRRRLRLADQGFALCHSASALCCVPIASARLRFCTAQSSKDTSVFSLISAEPN
jgi:hypothetical protein